MRNKDRDGKISVLVILALSIAILATACNETNMPQTDNNNSTPSNSNSGALLELKYQPMQCQETPWQKWYSEGNIQFIKKPTDLEIAIPYYASKNIEIKDFQRVDSGAMTCQACDTCPTSYFFTVKVAEGSLEAMKAEGWTN